MAFTATVLRVLIASPNDTKDERNSVPAVLRKWNREHSMDKAIVLLPIGWETDAYPTYEPGERPQEMINKQIVNDCDIVIAIFRARLGESTGEFESGTVEEIERSAQVKKPVAIYFANAYQEPIDANQLVKVKEYKSKLQKEGITWSFNDTRHFTEILRDHLTHLVEKAISQIPLWNSGRTLPASTLTTQPAQYDATNLGSTIHSFRQKMVSTAFRNDFFSLTTNALNKPVISIMLRMSEPFEVFESNEKDSSVELATDLFNSLFDAPKEAIVPEFYRDSVTISVDVTNESIFSFYAYKNGTVFVEHIFPHSQDRLLLGDIAAVYRHHSEKIVETMKLRIPESQVVAVGMKLSNWPDGGIVTEPLFRCTPPIKSVRGSHWETFEDPHGVDLDEFFKKFLFGALTNNQYRHFEEAVRGLDLQGWSFPNFPTMKVSAPTHLNGDQTQNQRPDKSSENGFTNVGMSQLVRKSKSKFDRVF